MQGPRINGQSPVARGFFDESIFFAAHGFAVSHRPAPVFFYPRCSDLSTQAGGISRVNQLSKPG
jgi:hypothetical protein